MRQRFKMNAVVSVSGNNGSYEISKKSHKLYISKDREERIEFIETINNNVSVTITKATDLIGRHTLVFNKMVLITAADCNVYFSAFGKNIKLV